MGSGKGPGGKSPDISGQPWVNPVRMQGNDWDGSQGWDWGEHSSWQCMGYLAAR